MFWNEVKRFCISWLNGVKKACNAKSLLYEKCEDVVHWWRACSTLIWERNKLRYKCIKHERKMFKRKATNKQRHLLLHWSQSGIRPTTDRVEPSLIDVGVKDLTFKKVSYHLHIFFQGVPARVLQECRFCIFLFLVRLHPATMFTPCYKNKCVSITRSNLRDVFRCDIHDL